MRIRKVRTASGKYALQIVSGVSGRLKIHKHVGSYSDGDENEKEKLLFKARNYIENFSGQSNLFDSLTSMDLDSLAILDSKPLFAYEFLSWVYERLGFGEYKDDVLKDLIIARVFLPSSKSEAREILSESFNRNYSLKTIYRHIKAASEGSFKEIVQKNLMEYVKHDLGDGLRLVFYDVTTLYFDSQVKVGLRKFGFSKDHKPQNVQIVVGLVTNKDGFPLYFDVFAGNTFEGNTFLNTVENVIKLLNNPKVIVVADSAMLSKVNIGNLDEKGIGFIVGARVSNLSAELIDTISSGLNKVDGKIVDIEYKDSFRLICQYLTKRAGKDRSDRQKQVLKAKSAISRPSRLTGRYKFLKKETNEKYSLNTGLILKSEKLEGIKGYITNTDLPPEEVIEKYHNLWKIEKSFRITKTDLAARPIFHSLDETIKTHLVIVFAGLAIVKFVELNTHLSIKRVRKAISKVLTHKVKNAKTQEVKYLNTQVEDIHIIKDLENIQSIRH